MNKAAKSAFVVLMAGWVAAHPAVSYADEDALGAAAGVEDYLVYAAKHNPGLEAAYHRWMAALAKVAQAEQLPDPKVSYAYFIEEVETRVGPQKQKFGISQMIPWFGTLSLKGGMAADTALAAQEVYEARKWRLFHDVRSAYYEYYYLWRSIQITREHESLLEQIEGVAQAKYKTGGTLSAVLKAQIELATLEDRISTLEELQGPYAAKLNAALGRAADAEIAWPEELSSREVKLDAEEIMEWMLEQSPMLNQQAASVEKEEKAVRLAKRKGYPSIMLGVDYIDTDEALMPDTPESGKDPVIAMVSVDLPIWRGSYREGVKEAESRREAAILEKEDTEHTLAAELKMTIYNFDDAQRRMALYGDALVPQAREAAGVAQEAYQTGNVDFLDLIDAERRQLEFELAYERARVDREKAISKIEQLIGRNLEEFAVMDAEEREP